MFKPDQCKITVRNTDHLGGASVPICAVRETLATSYVSLLLDGKITTTDLTDLQGFCESARFAGTKDLAPFTQFLEETGLNDHFTCDGCRYTRE